MDRRFFRAGFSIACVVTVTAVGADPVASRDRLIESIRSTHATLVDAQQNLSTLQRQGALGAREAADYQAWIQQMRTGLDQDCQQLIRSTDAPPPDDLPCDGGILPGAGAADIDTSGERTLEERTAELDASLGRSLGEFDDLLLREQERVKASKPDAGDGGGSSSGGGGMASAAGDDGAEQTGAEGGQQTSSRDTDRGRPGRSGPSSAPPDTPDGSDDDVVARQLREAAEKETDPELKKKLWEEYRKYKQGIQ